MTIVESFADLPSASEHSFLSAYNAAVSPAETYLPFQGLAPLATSL